MKQKEVTVKYKLGHSYNFIYELQNTYCPNCGKQTVWRDIGAGDYYEGPNHVCISCNTSFNIPSLNVNTNDDSDCQIIEQIKK